MDEALAKIRPHIASSLLLQRAPANLLIAIESTLQEQNTDPTPTAYFAALLTAIDGTIQKSDSSIGDGDILPAELYLLALVTPFVPAPIIRTNLTILLALMTPLFPSLIQHAPTLRSVLCVYHKIFLSLDKVHIETQGIRQAFATILGLCVDPRPKVRKKAADVVKDVLASPPVPLSRHPYADRVAEWVTKTLSEVSPVPMSKSGMPSSDTFLSTESALHILAFLRPLLPSLPSKSLPPIIEHLLGLPRLGNLYLAQSAYVILSEIFLLATDDETTDINTQLPNAFKVILMSPPSKSNDIISAAWLELLGSAMFAYNCTNPDACAKEFCKVWKALWNFLDVSDTRVRKAATRSLVNLCNCITPNDISFAIEDTQGSSTLRRIISQLTTAIDSLTYAHSVVDLLSIISSLISALRPKERSRASDDPVKTLLLPLICRVGNLRTQKGFEHKEAADATLAVAMGVFGPETLFDILPLNLEPEKRQDGSEPRAFLLPLLSHPHPSPLGHFISYFVPLSERMFDLQQKAESEGRLSEAKVWGVLVGQVWLGLVGYCHGPLDLTESFNPRFSQLLSHLLYNQPDLRPAILRALKVIVESNLTASNVEGSSPTNISKEVAAKNLQFLRHQVESWLAVLFNVFGSVNRDSRGMVGDAISSWSSIADEKEIHNAYIKLVNLFNANLEVSLHPSPNGDMIIISQDILILVLPYLSLADRQGLFSLCLSDRILSGRANGVQKRGYKILTKILESDNVKTFVDPAKVLLELDKLMDGLAPAAKKDRFNLLTLIISMLSPTALHMIPSQIPEAVLGTKEPSEKARSAAFDLILAMGRRMNDGGVVKRNLLDSMDEDVSGEVVANVEEFITMVAGGLAGASPHMISATVTAISRLVFEFKDTISSHMLTEIFTTLIVFLSSANREIVKSVLGFIKLAIHTLPVALIRSHLKTLVPSLLTWSNDHKNHFKVKVRHIFERLLRRCSWDEVYSCAGEEEGAKVLVNIKKRKDRAKRKRTNNGEDDGDGDELRPGKAIAGDAFEDILYGSESESEGSDDEGNEQYGGPNRKEDLGARLRLDDDEPLNLLQGVASRITTGSSGRRRKPGQDAARFKTDEITGKMLINDEEADKAPQTEDVVGTAYRENITSVDGFTRGPNGQIKFHKDTKKRRRDNEDADGDIEMADAETSTVKVKKNRRRSDVKFGQEFKAKKASGDIKKGGMDPYAYLSLSQAASKKGRRTQIGITGKR